jgi:glutathione peroxidase
MTIYEIEVKSIDGHMQRLDLFRGRVLLIVNVASQCTLTRQYSALECLYRKYKDKGFAVLGFPCNQFGNQEPGDEAAIKSFCTLNYGVSFPMFAKIDVNGDNAHPLYNYLKNAKRGIFGTRSIKWNFTKFLVGKDGMVLKRFGPIARAKRVEKRLNRLLA